MKAIFFDFDYTLGDATEAIVAGFLYGFQQMGLPEPEREAVRRTIGMTLENGYSALTGDNDPARRTQFRQLYVEKAGPLQVEVTRLFPGAEELLAALSGAGIPAGVVSTKRTSTLDAVLEARGVRQYLVSVTGGDKVDRPKPDPQGLLAALGSLAAEPHGGALLRRHPHRRRDCLPGGDPLLCGAQWNHQPHGILRTAACRWTIWRRTCGR